VVRIEVTVDVNPTLQHGLALDDTLLALGTGHYIGPNEKVETSEMRLSAGVLQLM